jgi:hypothetical protein
MILYLSIASEGQICLNLSGDTCQCCYSPGFLLRNFLCSQSDDHSQNNFAKFGYILDIKVEKKIESFYIRGYIVEPMFKSGEFGSFFFHEKSLVQVEIIFRRSTFGKNSPVKEIMLQYKNGKNKAPYIYQLHLDPPYSQNLGAKPYIIFHKLQGTKPMYNITYYV